MGFKSSFKRFFDLDEDLPDLHNREPETQARASRSDSSKKFRSRSTATNNVVRMPQVQQEPSTMQQEPSMVRVDPLQYADVLFITDHLKNKDMVVLNLQSLTSEEATRLIDFLSGAIHMTEGTIQKVKPFTFICSLETIDVSETIMQTIEERYS